MASPLELAGKTKISQTLVLDETGRLWEERWEGLGRVGWHSVRRPMSSGFCGEEGRQSPEKLVAVVEASIKLPGPRQSAHQGRRRGRWHNRTAAAHAEVLLGDLMV